MRLARRVEDLGAALREHGRQDDVLRPRHRWQVEHDAGAIESTRTGDKLRLRLLDFRAHLPQAPQVLLDAAGTDVVAPRPRESRFTEPADEGAEQKDGGPHAPAALTGHFA